MRVSSVQSYGVCGNYTKSPVKRSNVSVSRVNYQKQVPNFKGCDVFKIVGFFAGTAACCVLAPGLAMMGLAGVGAIPGMFAGAAIDDKIDEKNGKKD